MKKQEVVRGIDTVIGKKQLFTPELHQKIRQQALMQTKHKKRSFFSQKLRPSPLLISMLCIGIVVVLVFAAIQNPLNDTIPADQPQDVDVVPVEQDTRMTELAKAFYGLDEATPSQPLTNGGLALTTIESTLKFLAAFSTGNYAEIKQQLYSEAVLDEKAGVLLFYDQGTLIGDLNRESFLPFDTSSLEIVTVNEQNDEQLMLIVRIENHSYEIILTKDAQANNAYKIFTIMAGA
ncbi:MAG: hypothetical protein ABS882_03400 [Lysinibacillus sp.]